MTIEDKAAAYSSFPRKRESTGAGVFLDPCLRDAASARLSSPLDPDFGELSRTEALDGPKSGRNPKTVVRGLPRSARNDMFR